MVSIKLSLVLVVLMIATSVVAFIGKSASTARRAASSLSMGSFYDITEKDAAGNSVSFSKFKGKVVYGVNVATKCGYTASGYALLSKISKMNGIEVAIFPCNQVTYSLITLD
jgi:Glutathione peroxidase